MSPTKQIKSQGNKTQTLDTKYSQRQKMNHMRSVGGKKTHTDVFRITNEAETQRRSF